VREIEIRENQTLMDLHVGIQEAFGWMEDHLYSFWLDERFWGRGFESRRSRFCWCPRTRWSRARTAGTLRGAPGTS
jgi:hypothetical protein